ncbi:MAG: GNAT family protein, partial [bacterium]|nr:GNAT family protein [bacterium]
QREQGIFAFAITLPPSDRCIGQIGIYLESQFRRGEAFYWLDRRHRGQGITTEALNLITDWAFSEHGMARVHLVTHVDNPESQRVAERCGFQREGVLRAWQKMKDDQPDVVMWSRLPGD